MQAEQWDDDWEDELENGFAGEVSLSAYGIWQPFSALRG